MNIRLFRWLAPILGASIAFAQSPIFSSSRVPSSSYTPVVNSSTTKDTTCNTALNRKAWCNDFSIDTDYETNVPNTGATREYWLYVNDVVVNPDGTNEHPALAVNNSIPGPTIFADWGDEVVVHVFNNLTTTKNGTSFHFHGIRQNFTNSNDGVVSLTQCPIAPSHNMTYRWRATQYGSSWYHSHIGLQAWGGVFGGILINGPASENYDEDKGILFLNDWFSQTVDSIYLDERANGPFGPPFTLSFGLMNGTNVNIADRNNVTGHYFNTTVSPGKKYRLRLVNAAINTHFAFKIYNHNLTVIATDFVPIHNYTNDSIQIGMGQRYDVIFTADQAAVADSFWIQARSMDCSSNTNMNVTGFLSYKKNAPAPSVLQTNLTLGTSHCLDEPMSKLTPYYAMDVPSPIASSWNKSVNGFLRPDNQTNNFFRWYLNHTSMEVDWSNPALMQIYQNNSLGSTVGPFENTTGWINGSSLINLPHKDEWIYLEIVMDHTANDPHPIHLHGHDFHILAQGEQGQTFPGELNLKNPPRRDTALVSQGSYLVIAFKTDNPGIWLMHCHIGWHIEEGFALQFLERKSEITNLIDYDTLNETCAKWIDYSTKNNVTMFFESGV